MKFYKNPNFWIATIGIPLGIYLGIVAANNFDIFRLTEIIASWF